MMSQRKKTLSFAVSEGSLQVKDAKNLLILSAGSVKVHFGFHAHFLKK